MKVLKELPKSLYYSFFLRLKSENRLIKDKETVPVLVSLTSIPSRLKTLDIVIKSILNQTVLPEKIYLWLHKDLKEELPKQLKKINCDIFEIKYSDLRCSHRKLIHTLKEHPNENILTCDDDLIYDKNWLKNIYHEHLQNPNSIIANTTTQIRFNKNGSFSSFIEWRKVDINPPKNRLLGIGAWGILYPKDSLSKEVFNQEMFLRLTPKADDLWFKGMALLQGTNVVQAKVLPQEPIPIIGSQKIALKNENVNKRKNDIQWLALSEYYNLKEILNKTF